MRDEYPPDRTAIVTGGGRRIGAAIVEALLQDGWHVLLHCHESLEAARQRHGGDARVTIVAADLADPGAPRRIFAALEGLPAPALLVNNASRFVYDDLGDFTPEGWDAHFAVNLRAPALLAQAFAAAVPAGQGALIVNIGDAKLGNPNPDFFSYTLSKVGLAGLTELLARSLAPRGVRVCAIAPSTTLVSGPQTRENFEAVHKLNALGRGVEVADIVAALRYIVATSTLTGETISIDGGQRFLGLARDVQFVR